MSRLSKTVIFGTNQPLSAASLSRSVVFGTVSQPQPHYESSRRAQTQPA